MQTDSNPAETPQLAPVIFANLKEMVKIQRAAHESVLGFSWKKLWPFNQFLPQVDFIRVLRVLEQIRQHIRDQRTFLKQEQAAAPAIDQPFLQAVPAYFDGLDQTCAQLASLAQHKQDVLEKKAQNSIKILNQLLKDYQQAQYGMTKTGIVLQQAWMDRTRD